MKRGFQLLFLGAYFLVHSASAQDSRPTSLFRITGEVKVARQVAITDLIGFKEHDIGSVTITNHLGEKKSEAKGLKGILLKDVLAGVELNAELPKELSEFYFICRANDGYTVVFSWNELFNNSVGDAVYIITEKNGIRADKMNDSILLLSPGDFKTGRRHIKALDEIQVRRAEKKG